MVKFVTDRGNIMHKELMLGCGSRKTKDLRLPTWKEIKRNDEKLPPLNNRIGVDFEHLITLDINSNHKPDIVFDLTWIGIPISISSDGGKSTIDSEETFKIPSLISNDTYVDSEYDEIHAYEVLEHIGAQGDYKLFFAQFSEFHRILKPDGLLFATVPSWYSPWAWGDPSHTRVITSGTLAFLSQKQYAAQVGVTPMSDFRSLYTADFDTIYQLESADSFLFVLRAIK